MASVHRAAAGTSRRLTAATRLASAAGTKSSAVRLASDADYADAVPTRIPALRRVPCAGSPREWTIDGLRFRSWSSVARPDAPTYVFIHGVGMSHRSYLHLHGGLAGAATVHSLDLPGFAGLPVPRDDVTVTRMGTAIAELIGELSSSPVILGGHSMGAQWVAAAALRRPASVRAVVLMGPVTDDRHRTLSAQARALALDGLLEPPRVNAVVLGDYLRSGLRWFFAQVRHMVAYPIEQRVEELSVPVLVVRGSRDPIAGDDWVHRLAGHAAAGEVLVIPGSAHHVERTDARAVASGITAFLAQRSVRPA
ncbi:alpha/beta fold hydrolase [Microbacterium sp. NE2TL11]|nr:alpha/beta fold hydrolase [Microbacterium thalli]MDD7930032.1 alpha/beta fold hydrolase [Microbacterium thalli]